VGRRARLDSPSPWVPGGRSLSVCGSSIRARPLLAGRLRDRSDHDRSAVGVALGAYAVGHVPGGFLGDRIGEGNVVVISTLISAGTVLVVATAINVWMLFAGTIVFGLATALYGPTRFTIFTDIYPDRAGSAIGLTMAAGNIGNTVFPVAAAVIASYATWRYGIGAFSPSFSSSPSDSG